MTLLDSDAPMVANYDPYINHLHIQLFSQLNEILHNASETKIVLLFHHV